MGLFSRFSKKSSAEKIDDTVDEERDVDDVATEDTEAEESTDIDSDEAEPSDADNSTDDEDAAEDEDVDELDEDALLEKSAPYDRSEKGPFDASEDYPELNRLDLGALKVPVVDGMQVRLDTDDESQRVLAVTLIHEGGGIQLQAFATPRSEGLWNTVRKQLASGVTSQGGKPRSCTPRWAGNWPSKFQPRPRTVVPASAPCVSQALTDHAGSYARCSPARR